MMRQWVGKKKTRNGQVHSFVQEYGTTSPFLSVLDVSVQSLPTSTTEFVRCSEFELTLLFEEENVRHKVAVTPQTSIGELKALISSDLRLDQESLIFPTIQLHISVNEQTLASIHFPNSDNEKILRVCVRKRSDTDAGKNLLACDL